MDFQTKHKFLLLSEGDDLFPLVVPKEKKEKPKKVKEPKKIVKTEPVTKPAAEVKKSETQPSESPVKLEKEKQVQQSVGRGRGGSRGGRQDDKDFDQQRGDNRPSRGRGGAMTRGRSGTNERSQDNTDVMAERFGEAPARESNRGSYGRGARRGGINRPARDNDESFQGGQEIEKASRGRSYRGGRGVHRGGDDRRSRSDVTGVRAVDKKEGHGKGNWGDMSDEKSNGIEEENKENEPTGNTEAETAVAQDQQPTEGDGLQTPETPKVLSLAEFKAQLKKEESHFNTRKAGEGQDAKVYAKLVPLKKGEIEEEKPEYEVIVKQKPKKDLTYLANFSAKGLKQVPFAERREKAMDRRSQHPDIIAKEEEFPTLGMCA